MQYMTLASVAAIAVAASGGSASAAEKFTALDGISAEVMSASAMYAVRGGLDTVAVDVPAGMGSGVRGDGSVILEDGLVVPESAGQTYPGEEVENGLISIPIFPDVGLARADGAGQGGQSTIVHEE